MKVKHAALILFVAVALVMGFYVSSSVSPVQTTLYQEDGLPFQTGYSESPADGKFGDNLLHTCALSGLEQFR